MLKTSEALTLSTSPNSLFPGVGTYPPVALNTWQLIGFTASTRTDQIFTEVNVFSGTSSRGLYQPSTSSNRNPFDPSTISFFRIGGTTDSFDGDISIVRIMTPGGGVVRYSQ